jgi:CBS domain-containing protein
VVEADDGESRPVGIITDRDIVMEVLALGRDPLRTEVGEVMNSKLVIASASEDVSTALERMRTHGIRRLPVVDERECLLGVITLDDLLHWHSEQGNALAEIVRKGQTHEHRSKR